MTEARANVCPPKAEAIRAFARIVCETLADRRNDRTFTQPNVIRGLAEFLEIAARVQAKQLNSEQLIDSEEK